MYPLSAQVLEYPLLLHFWSHVPVLNFLVITLKLLDFLKNFPSQLLGVRHLAVLLCIHFILLDQRHLDLRLLQIIFFDIHQFILLDSNDVVSTYWPLINLLAQRQVSANHRRRCWELFHLSIDVVGRIGWCLPQSHLVLAYVLRQSVDLTLLPCLA